MQAGNGTGGPGRRAQNGAHVMVFIVRALALPLEVLLRRRFGARFFGFPTLAGLVAIPVWITFWPEKNPGPMTGFGALVLLMLIRARVESLRMVAKGDLVHTRYNGWPRIAAIFRRTSETKIKGFIEPVLGLGVGVATMYVYEPLGSFLIVSSIALGMINSTIDAVEQARAMEMNDALIEQQGLAERFREVRGDRTH